MLTPYSLKDKIVGFWLWVSFLCLQCLYLGSVLLLILILNVCLELESQFYLLGGRADIASPHAVIGHFTMGFLASLTLTTLVIIITAAIFWHVKHWGFKLMLIMLNILAICHPLFESSWVNQQRVFAGYHFDPAVDNSLQAVFRDGILFESISDLAMLSLCCCLVGLAWLSRRLAL